MVVTLSMLPQRSRERIDPVLGSEPPKHAGAHDAWAARVMSGITEVRESVCQLPGRVRPLEARARGGIRTHVPLTFRNPTSRAVEGIVAGALSPESTDCPECVGAERPGKDTHGKEAWQEPTLRGQ